MSREAARQRELDREWEERIRAEERAAIEKDALSRRQRDELLKLGRWGWMGRQKRQNEVTI